MPPSVLFALILALTVGFLFHGIFGRRLWQLPFFLLSAVVGVFAGQVVAVLAGMEYVRIGNVPVAMATAGAVAMLALCWFFTAPIQEGESRTRRRARRMLNRQERASA